MRTYLALGLLLLGATNALAKPPSEASIDRLLTLMHVEKIADAETSSIEPLMHNAMTQALGDQKLTAAQQHVIDNLVADFTKIIKEEASATAMRSTYATIYREAFTQEELDGMVRYYESPSGRAFIEKMPLVMKRSIELMQARMGPLIQKFQVSAQKAIAELKATSDKPAAEAPAK